jgi:hypothetical protein
MTYLVPIMMKTMVVIMKIGNIYIVLTMYAVGTVKIQAANSPNSFSFTDGETEAQRGYTACPKP